MYTPKVVQHKDRSEKACHRCGSITTHHYITIAENGGNTFVSGVNEMFRALNLFGDYAGVWMWRCGCGHVRTANEKCIMRSC